MNRFREKVCLVTGGASGIGAKTAEMFVEQGGKVAVCDVDDALGNEIAAHIVAVSGGENAIFIHTDVADPDACKGAIDQTVSTFGSCLLYTSPSPRD